MTNLLITVLENIPEIQCGDNLADIIGDALSDDGIQSGDILVITSKIVSKAEGRQIAADDREEAITSETVRLVASRTHTGGVTRIVENRQGLILAAAGVDNSNTPEGTVLLLPEDPDASARGLCTALRLRFNMPIGVIISDTLGRPWRAGQTDAAIGAAGLRVIDDHRGTQDSHGNLLTASATAVGDEIASAADLVKGKSYGSPVAVVRGLDQLVLADEDQLRADSSGRALIRSANEDLFRLGSAEAYAQGFAAGQASARGSEESQSVVPE